MRQTIREIEVNVAYRWFLGYSLTEKIPHFSTFNKNYERRFKNTYLFESIFKEILARATKCGFVDSSNIYIDSTHIKASDNKKKYTKVEVYIQAKHYKEKLEKEIAILYKLKMAILSTACNKIIILFFSISYILLGCDSMKNIYIFKIARFSLPFVSLALLLSYILFDLNSKIGGIGFILYSMYDLYDNYINLRKKNELNKISILLNIIMLILGLQMLLFPSIF